MCLKRIQVELFKIKKDPPLNCSASLYQNDPYHWLATIVGTKDSPYQGGIFYLDIHLSDAYPFQPPKIKFLTKIYHPNITSHGQIKNVFLWDQWSPGLTISKVLQSISSIFTEIKPNDWLELQIAQIYMNNRAKFQETAKQWTRKYAQ